MCIMISYRTSNALTLRCASKYGTLAIVQCTGYRCLPLFSSLWVRLHTSGHPPVIDSLSLWSGQVARARRVIVMAVRRVGAVPTPLLRGCTNQVHTRPPLKIFKFVGGGAGIWWNGPISIIYSMRSPFSSRNNMDETLALEVADWNCSM